MEKRLEYINNLNRTTRAVHTHLLSYRQYRIWTFPNKWKENETLLCLILRPYVTLLFQGVSDRILYFFWFTPSLSACRLFLTVATSSLTLRWSQNTLNRIFIYKKISFLVQYLKWGILELSIDVLNPCSRIIIIYYRPRRQKN